MQMESPRPLDGGRFRYERKLQAVFQGLRRPQGGGGRLLVQLLRDESGINGNGGSQGLEAAAAGYEELAGGGDPAGVRGGEGDAGGVLGLGDRRAQRPPVPIQRQDRPEGP